MLTAKMAKISTKPIFSNLCSAYLWVDTLHFEMKVDKTINNLNDGALYIGLGSELMVSSCPRIYMNTQFSISSNRQNVPEINFRKSYNYKFQSKKMCFV